MENSVIRNWPDEQERQILVAEYRLTQELYENKFAEGATK